MGPRIFDTRSKAKIKNPPARSFRDHNREMLHDFVANRVEEEVEFLQKIQARFRHPFLDFYLKLVAVACDHVFFTYMLPLLFWLGFEKIARGLTIVVLLTVAITGWVKDYVSSPRPPSPPLERLSFNSAHSLEYGFPSTHSAYVVGTAIFVTFSCFEVLSTDDTLSSTSIDPGVYQKSILMLVGLTWFLTFSVMFGRIYCGMHSLIDVYGGATLGTIISLPFSIYHDYLDTFFYLGGIEGPALASFCVFLILYYHPFFPGKCPCYEDTFSALSAGLGVVYGSFMLNIHHPIYSSEFPDVPFYLYRTVLGVFIVAGWKAISKPVIRRVFALGFDRLLKKFRLYKKKKYSALGNQKSASTLSSNSSKGLHVFSFDLDVGSGPDKIYSDNNMARIPIYILIGYISVYVMPWLFFYLGV